MSLDLTALGNYTDETKNELIRKSILGGRSIALANIQAGIKTTAPIQIFESDAVFQAGGCGWNASGTTTLTQRPVTVSELKINEAFCPKELEAKWTQTLLRAGSEQEELPFEAMLAEEKSAKIQKALEELMWRGDTAGSGNLAMTDGLIKIIEADGATVTGTTLALDAANIITAVDEMVAAVPADMLMSTDLHIFVSYETYRLYAAQLRAANMFHYTGEEGADFMMTIPGTNIKMIAVAGLNGQGKMILAEASNLVVGVDLLGEEESFKIRYSEDNEEVRFSTQFKVGFTTAFPERIVIKA